jgi:tetratricopeptide (TPR) repeat protein
VLAQALCDRHVAVWNPLNVEERLELTRELSAVAREAGRHDLEVVCSQFRICALLEIGDGDGSRAEADRCETMARTYGMPPFLARVSWMISMYQVIEGRLSEALETIQHNLEVGQRFSAAEAFRTYLAQLGHVLYHLGRVSETEGGLRANAGLDPQHYAWMAALALLMAETDRVDEARDVLDQLASVGFGNVAFDTTWPWAMIMVAEACHLAGDAIRAGELYELMRPLEGRVAMLFSRGLCGGPFDLYLGSLGMTLGRWDDARRHLGIAIELSERLGARPSLARARLRLAEVLLHEGEHARAAELAESVAALASGMGMVRVEERARRLLDERVSAG